MDNTNSKTELSDDELKTITGGEGKASTVMIPCPNCSVQKKVPFKVYSGGRAVCTVCGHQIFM